VNAAVYYNDSYFSSMPYEWQQAAYSTFLLVETEQTLFDKDWNYNIKQCLKKCEESYGEKDIVLLWPTYPQLGWDNCDQYSFYRDLPCGSAKLRQLAANCTLWEIS
jgi:hypothetical protein